MNRLADGTFFYLSSTPTTRRLAPMGEEAFAEARRRDVPFLLISIGYAACRWCHLMR